jgi:hypothetical protein
MPHGVESLKLWRVETEKHGFYLPGFTCNKKKLFCFVLFCVAFFGTNGQIHSRKEPVD